MMSANVYRNDPFGRLFEDFFVPQRAAARNGRVYPAMNIWANESAYFVEADVPGYSMEELDITVAANEVTVKGTAARVELPEKATFFRQERNKQSFSRTIELPENVKADGVEATLKNGVLTLTLPMSETARPKKITVKAA